MTQCLLRLSGLKQGPRVPLLHPLKCNQTDFTLLLLPGQWKACPCKMQTSAWQVRAGRKDTRDGEELGKHVKGRTPGHLPRGHIGQDKLQFVKQVPKLKAKRERLEKTALSLVTTSKSFKRHWFFWVEAMRSIASTSQRHLSSR